MSGVTVYPVYPIQHTGPDSEISVKFIPRKAAAYYFKNIPPVVIKPAALYSTDPRKEKIKILPQTV